MSVSNVLGSTKRIESSARKVFEAVALLSLACSTEPDRAPLPLDELLSGGQARAGIITKSSELIGGDEAKAGLGDFKLYNSKIAVIVAAKDLGRGLLPYGGNIIDADVVRPGQLGRTTFGEVLIGLDLAVLHPSNIVIAKDGRDGGPAVIRVEGRADGIPLFDALLGNILSGSRPTLEVTAEYTLEPDADWVRMKYSAKNVAPDKVTAEIGLPIIGFLFSHSRPFLPGWGFVTPDSGATGPYFAAFDDDVGYLYYRPDVALSFIYSDAGTAVIAGLGDPMTIRAQETLSFEHILIVTDGDVSRTQERWQRLTGGPTLGSLNGRVTSGGMAVAGAKVNVLEASPRSTDRDFVTQTRTLADGSYSARVPPGSYKIVVSAEGHPISPPREVTVASEGDAQADVELELTASLTYRIADEADRLIPAKLSIVPTEGAPDRLPERFGVNAEPGGVQKTEYAITGSGTLAVRPGHYALWASRGAEYEVATSSVSLEPGESKEVSFVVRRVVDTTGWLASDTHIHAQLSTDSPDRYPFKVKAMVVEGLELPISTEHEAIGDFNPAIEKLGLGAFMKGIVGSEISTTTYGHFNGFPLVADPNKPGNGRIDWIGLPPAKTFAAIRANAGDPYVQANHPRSTAIKGYFTSMGFDRDVFKARRDDFSSEFDGIEVANGCGTNDLENVMADWFSFLNHGQKKWATGSTDSHRAEEGEMGFPRTYVAMPTDDPARASLDDFRKSTKAGHMIITCGPFVEMKIQGASLGDTITANGSEVMVSARVAAPSWVDVDTIEVIVNGAVATSVIVDSQDVERFRGEIRTPIPSGRDAWIILRVRGAEPNQSWPRGRPSWAFTNPIFVDGNADGAWTM